MDDIPRNHCLDPASSSAGGCIWKKYRCGQASIQGQRRGNNAANPKNSLRVRGWLLPAGKINHADLLLHLQRNYLIAITEKVFTRRPSVSTPKDVLSWVRAAVSFECVAESCKKASPWRFKGLQIILVPCVVWLAGRAFAVAVLKPVPPICGRLFLGKESSPTWAIHHQPPKCCMKDQGKRDSFIDLLAGVVWLLYWSWRYAQHQNAALFARVRNKRTLGITTLRKEINKLN